MPTKTYQKLIHESPKFYICQYGTNSVLGMQGTARQIELAHNLFCNFDKVSKLHWLGSDFAYLTISTERIRKAIKLFLYVNLLHSKEVASYDTWDEEKGEYNLFQDTKTAENLSAQDADLFLTSLEVKSFIPSDFSTPAYEYISPLK